MLSSKSWTSHTQSLLKLTSITLLGLALTGCGFRPLYGTSDQGSSILKSLAAIDVHAKNDSIGRELEFGLENVLAYDGTDAYQLVMTYERTTRNIVIEQDQEVTRKNLQLTVNFVLRESGTNKALFKSTAFSVVGYNLVDAPFANLMSKRDANKRAVAALYDDIRAQLAIYFQRQQKS
ncbi:MAG: hypothetical protein COB70_000090 [Rhodobiaceae bacterium]|nr:hypothetical protein [Rhodobiaceae bacterium]